MKKLTRQQMAGLASFALLVAIVTLVIVGGDAAGEVRARLEGMLALTFPAFVGETIVARSRSSGNEGGGDGR